MTKIKLCGLSQENDILTVNELMPDLAGFVFFKKSKRYTDPDRAELLRELLDPKIRSVGVFVDEDPEVISDLFKRHIFDIVQLHGSEDDEYIKRLSETVRCPILKAFGISDERDVEKARKSAADMVLLDYRTAGSGNTFDWDLIKDFERPYFLAGGLDSLKAASAVKELHPYGVDVSSGIETNGKKDRLKMTGFVYAVRNADKI